MVNGQHLLLGFCLHPRGPVGSGLDEDLQREPSRPLRLNTFKFGTASLSFPFGEAEEHLGSPFAA